MASYKVPQDVEADDKLIGPFSFRQFIYLIIVAMAGALAWALSQLFVALAIIPLPIIIFFGALALPLRKDQPMEIYMAAMVSYYLKPRNRNWDPEGIESLIEITAPKVVEVRRTKELSQNEAQERLSYLANIVDTGGWAIRGVANPVNSSLNSDVYLEAQSAEDILDTHTSIAQNFDQMMTRSTARMHEEAKARMMQASMPQAQPAQPIPTDPYAAVQQAYTPSNPLDPAQQPVMPPIDPQNLEFNPYPTFHQSIIQPIGDIDHHAKNDLDPAPGLVIPAEQPVSQNTDPNQNLVQSQLQTQTQQTIDRNDTVTNKEVSDKSTSKDTKDTSDIQLTADIINLANNPDISIETIAHEAHRIHKKVKEEPEEVIISLR